MDPQGSAGSLALDQNGNPHIAYYVNPDYNETRGGTNYTFWNGSSWNTQTVDQLGPGTKLFLDSNNNPHIIGVSNYNLKQAYWNGTGWALQSYSLLLFGASDFSITLDAKGNPHIAYSIPMQMANGSSGQNLTYAAWTGSEWTGSIIDFGVVADWFPSLVLDSRDIPHVSYCYDPVAVDSTKTLKYATIAEANWSIQTIGPMISSSSQIVVDSKDNPHITCVNGTYINNTLEYVSWNGTTWNNQTVFAEQSCEVGAGYITFDRSDNPHIAYGVKPLQNSAADLHYTAWTGKNWNTQLVDLSASLGNMVLDSSGKPHIVYSKPIIGGNGLHNNLTYASLEESTITPSPSLLPSASPFSPEFSQFLGVSVVLALILVVSLVIVWKKKQKKKLNKM